MKNNSLVFVKKHFLLVCSFAVLLNLVFCNYAQAKSANDNVGVRYIAKEDMNILAWGTGSDEDEALSNAKDNAVAKAVSLIGNGSNAECVVRDARSIITVKQGDGSYKVAVNTIIRTPMLNGGSSSGATALFGGYSAKERMMESNKAMEISVMNELLRQVKIMLPQMYSRRFTVFEPKHMTRKALEDWLQVAYGSRSDFAESVAYNRDNGRAAKLFDNSPQWKAIYNSVNQWLNSTNYSSLVKFKIKYVENVSGNNINEMITRALKGMGLTKEEINEYDKVSKPKTRFTYHIDADGDTCLEYLRSSDKDCLKWVNRYVDALYDYFLNFDIVDNFGVKSHIGSGYNAMTHKLSCVGSFAKPSLSERKDIFIVPLSNGNYDTGKVHVPNSDSGSDRFFYSYFMKGTGILSPYIVLTDRLLGYYPYFYNQLDADDTSTDPYVEGTPNETDDYGSFANRNKKIDMTVFTSPQLYIDFLMPTAKLGDYNRLVVQNGTRQQQSKRQVQQKANISNRQRKYVKSTNVRRR